MPFASFSNSKSEHLPEFAYIQKVSIITEFSIITCFFLFSHFSVLLRSNLKTIFITQYGNVIKLHKGLVINLKETCSGVL